MSTVQGGRLVFGKKGHVFGPTSEGGTGNITGTVFTLIPTAGGSYNFTTIYNFGDVGSGDADYPIGGLRFDELGHLYGTSAYGGSFDWGTVFELVHRKGSWTETVLHSFDKFATTPSSGVTTDGKGHFFGTTLYGGANNAGTVFEITP